MKYVLIVGWVGLLAFEIWEFINANSLPAKYGAASPTTFRMASGAIGIFIVLSLIYLLKKN